MHRRIAVAKIGRVLPALIALFAFHPHSMAADASSAPAPAAAVDEEEQVDEGLKRFGYLAGLARGCVAENQRAALEREALDLNAGIGRLLGIDRAFLFASSFGYGTTVVVEIKDCTEVLKAYESRVEKFRANRGGAQ
jgi:hypothetical protein